MQQASRAFCREVMRLATHRQARKEAGRIVIGGHHIVTEYIGNHHPTPCTQLAVTERYIRRHPEFLDLAAKCPVILMEEARMARILKEPTPEGVLATIPFPPTHQSTFDPSHRRSLWLYGPFRDPGNVGTLARSALALGFTQLILSDPLAVDHLHPTAIRASKGALLYTGTVSDFSPSLLDLADIKLVMGDVGGIPIDQYQNNCSKLVLVLGSESQGLAGFPGDLRRKADCVSIATSPAMPFLNVAIAGSILMHALR